MHAMKTFTSFGCVKHASGMSVHSVQHLHVHMCDLQPWELFVYISCVRETFSELVCLTEPTLVCLFAWSQARIAMTVSCQVSVFDRRDPKERKRERDKAEHMRLCEPHFVHAIVDELTDMSDLGPTKEIVYVEFKVRRADNMKHKIERCTEGNMTHGRMRCGERGGTHKMPGKSTGVRWPGEDRNQQVKAWSTCSSGGRDSNNLSPLWRSRC